jgi:diguanylate cyclase (GGDEF)-like protein
MDIPQLGSGRILVVDDSADVRALIRRHLEGAGYSRVLDAASAEEAFGLLGLDAEGRGDGREAVDLVFLDVLMPGMDGIEACRRIREARRLADLPVIVITAYDDLDTLRRSFDAGAMDFIGKPVHKDELLARVRNMLMLKAEMDRRKQREAELTRMTEELMQHNRELKKLSYHDGLTGLANRRQFDRVLHGEWDRQAREGDHLSVLVMDIDDFKPYNDTYGHLAGDECLRKIGRLLRGHMRRPADLAARYGGEEFACILPGTSPVGARHLAEDIRVGIRRMGVEHSGGNAAKVVTVSIGVASAVPVAGDPPEGLVELADLALYRAKTEGKDRVSVAPDV